MRAKEFQRKSLPSLKIIQKSCILKQKESNICRLKKYQSTYYSSQENLKKYQKLSKANNSQNKTKQLAREQNQDKKMCQKDVNKQIELCQKLLVNINLFKKLFLQSQRKKIIIKKIYGWNEAFQKALFNQEQFIIDLTKKKIHNNLCLCDESSNTRTIFKKLKFFVKEFEQFNKKQTDIQTKFFRSRLEKNLQNLQIRFKEINRNKNSRLKEYVNDMIQSHNQMKNNKAKITNQIDFVQELMASKGQLKIDPYCISVEQNVKQIQLFIK